MEKTTVLTSPPLKALQITSPSVIHDKRACNTECTHEYDSLLTRGTPVLSFLVSRHRIEQGHADRPDADWQVLKVLHGPLCMPTPHVLELVQLKHANFGLRWRKGHQGDPILPPSCIVGPHWHLMVVTWSVFFLMTLTVNVLTFNKATLMEVTAGLVLSGICLICYALVGCTDPGIVKRIDMPLDDTYTYCDHCGSYRPEGALHCMDCRVCIEEYDHHCPWTGKCVGKGNVRYFYAWLLFLVLAFVYEIIECTTYLLPPEGETSMLDSPDDSLEILLPVVTPVPRL